MSESNKDSEILKLSPRKVSTGGNGVNSMGVPFPSFTCIKSPGSTLMSYNLSIIPQ